MSAVRSRSAPRWHSTGTYNESANPAATLFKKPDDRSSLRSFPAVPDGWDNRRHTMSAYGTADPAATQFKDSNDSDIKYDFPAFSPSGSVKKDSDSGYESGPVLELYSGQGKAPESSVLSQTPEFKHQLNRINSHKAILDDSIKKNSSSSYDPFTDSQYVQNYKNKIANNYSNSAPVTTFKKFAPVVTTGRFNPNAQGSSVEEEQIFADGSRIVKKKKKRKAGNEGSNNLPTNGLGISFRPESNNTATAPPLRTNTTSAHQAEATPEVPPRSTRRPERPHQNVLIDQYLLGGKKPPSMNKHPLYKRHGGVSTLNETPLPPPGEDDSARRRTTKQKEEGNFFSRIMGRGNRTKDGKSWKAASFSASPSAIPTDARNNHLKQRRYTTGGVWSVSRIFHNKKKA